MMKSASYHYIREKLMLSERNPPPPSHLKQLDGNFNGKTKCTGTTNNWFKGTSGLFSKDELDKSKPLVAPRQWLRIGLKVKQKP